MAKRMELQITDAEWEVMEAVWARVDQLPSEIIGRVQPIRNRSHRTIRTLLNRLVAKGAVKVSLVDGQYLYSAAVSRKSCVRAAASTFSQRFFSGNVASLLTHFVEHEPLSTEEVDDLRAKLDAMSDSAKVTGGEKRRAIKGDGTINSQVESSNTKSRRSKRK